MDRGWFKEGKIRKRGGFTLLELVVVMAILGILAAGAGKGFLGYYRYGEWKKRNEYAKTIYLAVQSELTRRSQSGQPSGFTGLWKTGEKGICCLEGGPEDYLRYREGRLLSGEDERGSLVLYEILDPYIADKSLFLEGAIRIELEPEKELVSKSYYGPPEGMGRFFAGQTDKKDGKEEVLKKLGIGSYRTEEIPAGKKEPLPKPEIRKLRLWKEAEPEGEKGRIAVSWQLWAEDIEDWKRLSYQLTIYSGESELGRILLNPGREEEDGITEEYGGIPKRLWILDFGGKPQVIQALFCREGERKWCCIPVSLEESRYEITCFLDGGFWEEEEKASASDFERSDRVTCFSLSELLSEVRDGEEDIETEISCTVNCTVVAYGQRTGAGAMKESNEVTVFFPDKEEESTTDTDEGEAKEIESKKIYGIFER